MFVAERIDIQYTTTHGKLPGLIHKILSPEAYRHKTLQQGIYIQLLAHLYGYHVAGKRGWVDHLLKQRFRVGDQHLFMRVFAGYFGKGLRAQHHMAAVQLIEVARTLKGIRKETYIQSLGKVLYIIVEIGSLFAVVEYEDVIVVGKLPQCGSYKIHRRTAQIIEVNPHLVSGQSTTCRNLFYADIILV